MPGPLSTQAMRDEYSSSLCALSPGGDISTVDSFIVHGWSRPLWVVDQAVPAFQALSRNLAAYSYPFSESAGGTLVCRPITGGSAPSAHAYGVAIDINPSRNPYIPDYSGQPRSTWTDMPQAMVDDILSIRTARTNRQVFEWGGNWNTVKDGMHFQLGALKSELAEGLVGSGTNTDPTQPTLPEPTGGEYMFLGMKLDGTESALGEALQTRIVYICTTLHKEWGKPLPTYGVDGAPGDETLVWFLKVIGRSHRYDAATANGPYVMGATYEMLFDQQFVAAAHLDLKLAPAIPPASGGLTRAQADKAYYPRAEADKTFLNADEVVVDIVSKGTVTDKD